MPGYELRAMSSAWYHFIPWNFKKSIAHSQLRTVFTL